MELIDEALERLQLIILARRAEHNRNDNEDNGSPELDVVSAAIFNTVLTTTYDPESVAKYRPQLAELYEKVDAVYTAAITMNEEPRETFPQQTALLVGELRFILRLLSAALDILPPPDAHPKSIGVRQFYGEHTPA